MAQRLMSLRSTIGAGLVLAGVGAVLISASSERVQYRERLGGNLPVDAGATNRADFTAHNSPTLVRNPRRPDNLAVSNRIDAPRFSCALNVSHDAGATWSQTGIPAPRGEEHKCFAPDVAFDSAGTLFLTYVTLRGRGNVPSAVWLVRSQDGGRTLSRPQRLLGPLSFQVRLTAHPEQPGRLYLTWLRASGVGLFQFSETGNPVSFKTSDDGGRTWSRQVRVSDAGRARVVAPSTAVGPGRTLYVLYLDLGDDRLDYEGGHRGRGGAPYGGTWQLVLARSTDDGATWSQSPVPDRVVPTERFISFIPPYPSLAVDRASGQVFAAFEDGRLGDPDVRLWTLPAGGSAWRTSVRVNDTPPRDGTAQYRPALSVAPGGRLDIAYYDRRGDPRDVMNGVSLQSSSDGAKRFGPRVALSTRAFDSRIGFGSDRGLPDLGSRIGLLSDARRALAVWADTRAGTQASGKQDIAAAMVVFSTRERAIAGRTPLRIGGILAILAGLALLASALLGRGGRGRPGPPPAPERAAGDVHGEALRTEVEA
jgi:hypothetical protein